MSHHHRRHGDEAIAWSTEDFDADTDISTVGTVVEASYFNGPSVKTGVNPTPTQLTGPIVVNGVSFVQTDFSTGGSLANLSGHSYDTGEHGHTAVATGYTALIDGITFDSGVGSPSADLTGPSIGQQ